MDSVNVATAKKALAQEIKERREALTGLENALNELETPGYPVPKTGRAAVAPKLSTRPLPGQSARDYINKLFAADPNPLHRDEIFQRIARMGCRGKKSSISTELSVMFNKGLLHRVSEGTYQRK